MLSKFPLLGVILLGVLLWYTSYGAMHRIRRREIIFMVGRIQGVDIDQVVRETELTLANILVGKKYENFWLELEIPITSHDLLSH
jgi:hypothetical protein